MKNGNMGKECISDFFLISEEECFMHICTNLPLIKFTGWLLSLIGFCNIENIALCHFAVTQIGMRFGNMHMRTHTNDKGCTRSSTYHYRVKYTLSSD